MECHHRFDMTTHGGERELLVVRGVCFACLDGLLVGVLDRAVSLQRIVGACLVGKSVGDDVAFDQPFEEGDRVAGPSDGDCCLLSFEFDGSINRGVEVFDEFVEVCVFESAFES